MIMAMKFQIKLMFTLISFIGLTRTENEINQHAEPETLISMPEDDHSANQMDEAISNVRSSAEFVEKLSQEAIQPAGESDHLNNDMMDTIDELIESVKEPTQAYKFLKARGIEKVILHNLGVNYSKLRERVLILLKSLFEIAPTTTDSVIPISIIDRLLDIFENDNNLAIKAHVLDILYIWLPENPKAQVRVMKLKGLEPFYHQISKLDTSVISTLLDLFNKILVEHINVLRNRKQESKVDSDTLILYQRIGLIERMSTPKVCNGLVNIFESTWSYTNIDNDVIAPVFHIIKNMKPYCINILRGHDKAINLFGALLKYVKDDSKKGYFETIEVNATDVKEVLENFVNELMHPAKDEL